MNDMYSYSVCHFLFLGNLIPEKGVFILVDACKILAERHYNFICSIAGGDSNLLSKLQLEQKIQQHRISDQVKVIGACYGNSKEALLNSVDVLVLPTMYGNECFPLVLLEAMQHSLPIISTPVGAIPDMVTEGVNGLLVPENDSTALAEAMKKLVVHPQLAHDMGIKGHARFLGNYTIRQFEQNLLDILKTSHPNLSI